MDDLDKPNSTLVKAREKIGISKLSWTHCKGEGGGNKIPSNWVNREEFEIQGLFLISEVPLD